MLPVDAIPAAPRVVDRSAPIRPRLVLGLLFASALLNYVDRQALSVLKPYIKADFHLDDAHYSYLVAAFMVPYIVMYVLSGRLVDRWGSRLCMKIFVGVWSLATVLSGFAKNIGQLAATRALLGAAEPGNFPAGIRTLTLLFPPERRGFAMAFFSAGSALGAIIAVPLVATAAQYFDWRATFWVLGAIGLAWIAAWNWGYRPTRIQEAVTTAAGRPRWGALLRRRELWGIVLARFISDPVWYFYLFWLPGYFSETLRLPPGTIAAIGWIPFLAADLGGIGFCSVSDAFVRRGVPGPVARQQVMIALACVAPLGCLAPHAGGLVPTFIVFSVVGIVCLTWTFSTASLVGDLFPPGAVGAVVGVMGACGATGGLLFNLFVGQAVDRIGYGPVFLAAACLHPVAAIVLWSLVGRRPRIAAADLAANPA